MMTSVREALGLILGSARRTPVGRMPLRAAAGHVLAEDVRSDIDMPPFDRAAMDGFAVSGGGSVFDLVGEIAAGDADGSPLDGRQAAPIMTGAPVPRGADRVVIVEDCEVRGASVTVSRVPDAGENICLRGEDIRAGQVVLEAGIRLAPQHLGIAAMAGREVVAVFGRPVVTVLTTGTEVVPATWALTPGMVRDANLPLICAQLETAGFPPAAWMHSNDDPASLRETAAQLLSASDVLVAAGGVSMGTRDFVPSILEELGMDIRVRGVAQKPGKPLLFAVDPEGRSAFGLPGNPVSVMVSLEEYVLPHLRRMSGLAGCRKRVFEGVITDAYGKEPGRLHFLRVEARREGTEWTLRLPESSGSGDLMSTSAANGLALVGEAETRLLPGDRVPFHFLYSHAGELSFE